MTRAPILLVLEHIRATVQHKLRVADYMWRARGLAGDLGIPARDWARRALVHDLSKFGPVERSGFALGTPVLKIATYESVEYRRGLALLGPALVHHYRANTHHPEHFHPQNGLRYMDPADRLEMLCDWAAAVERSPGGDVFDSIAKNATRFGYGPETAAVFTGWAWRALRLRPANPQARATLDERFAQEDEVHDAR